jgi:hypothetical protein
MYGLMSEQSINETLEAIRKSGEEVLKSKENVIKFLQEIGILNENGEPTERYLDSLENE